MRQPPRVPTSLLLLFASTPNGESLAGDLIEKYQNGRSRWWYWHQVVVAIAQRTIEEIRTNTWGVLRALAVGWLIYLPSSYFRNVIIIPGRMFSVATGNWLLTSGHDSVRWWWMKSHATEVPAFAVWWVACACIGWLMARTYRRRSAPLVLLFVTLVMAYDVVWIGYAVMRSVAMVNQDQRIGTLVGTLRPMGAWCGLIVGGLRAARRADDHRQLAN